jgi:hypothetical protein
VLLWTYCREVSRGKKSATSIADVRLAKTFSLFELEKEVHSSVLQRMKLTKCCDIFETFYALL